jgi:hypothetical protein
MAEHTVAADEDLAAILTAHYPRVSQDSVVSDAKNKGLFARRSPNVLRAGDRLYIPEPAEPPKEVEVTTGKAQRFIAQRALRNLVLKLLDEKRAPLANQPYELIGGHAPITGTTDGSGMLRARVPIDIVQWKVTVNGRLVAIRVGAMDPITTTNGVQARLRNLGYYPGAEDDAYGVHTSRAIAAFQRDEGLEVSGHMTPETRDALEAKHKG